jgi:hypothetical protein
MKQNPKLLPTGKSAGKASDLKKCGRSRIIGLGKTA